MFPEVKLTEIPAPDFDLATTLDSGQVFHWEKIDDGFCGTIGEMAVSVEQHSDVLKVHFGGTSKPVRETPALPGIVARYFALDHRLAEICRSFPDDKAMNSARDFCRGLRIIRQPKWECLGTFICSSMKQVAHIRQISIALRRRFGQARQVNRHIVHTFPTPDRIARSSEKELRECALGYRAKNLLATAQLVSSGEADLESWVGLSDTDLRTKLGALPGVGAKIANCVMLFAYERLRAFPIDVWIERALKRHYFPRKRNLTAGQLRRFSESYFGNYGGYAQQYLFHYARTTSRQSGTTRDSSRLRSPRRPTARQAITLGSARNDKEGNARTASRRPKVMRDSSRLRPAAAGATARQATALRSAWNDKKGSTPTASR
jgi:N-glycosylase/DNA lyase